MSNVGGAFGGFLSGAVLNPLQQLTDTAGGLINSPFTYLLMPILGVIVLVTVMKTADTAQVVAQNPESIKAVAQAMR